MAAATFNCASSRTHPVGGTYVLPGTKRTERKPSPTVSASEAQNAGSIRAERRARKRPTSPAVTRACAMLSAMTKPLMAKNPVAPASPRCSTEPR
ncbi:hypothetical protein [Corallococcus macrosporus]|uniref:Uncharacterized protein n=1 Tax=Corallococcus macrosporus DSM 14697 TaxID=1189310 RepID=A0A286SGJ7_9BACT|nr:hypothetical protein [Corallococcus macrosporus]ATB51542.1 hypothetical protein MYMAC_007205 [Corallococcus macrosporus DSM 14697]